MAMEKKNFTYDPEIAQIMADPYLHAVQMHIENVEKEENTTEVKKEYILGLETLLVNQDLSTASSIIQEIGNMPRLVHIPGVEPDVCVMLGHISQNVQEVAQKLIDGRIFSECIKLFKTRPTALSKILFLFTVLNNTLPSMRESLLSANEDPADIEKIEDSNCVSDEKSKSRLSALKASLLRQ
ncbi:hypothetical protein NEFER03_0607 [Nematocida sp. LUAm3]|nr:hypothetical protein NEFER03_0607 [Nematocida sp. LUAm3]KAI5175574.1 hypothetical protein NEFER02_1480 [Nematocida sp. LUAm2]KAI5178396.1 hypothetical protein NEFER01_1543 [Nematocida sp. LUAm1]